MTPKLSVLIPTTPDRQPFLIKLANQFHEQLGESKYILTLGESMGLLRYSARNGEVEVLCLTDNYEYSIGYKRNVLLQAATGAYIEFIDSDDRIGDKHFEHVLAGIATGADCCSLKGIITEDGKSPLIFEHSIRYDAYKTNPDHMPVRYERFPNHLNCIKASIAKQFKFPDKSHGEDTDWAVQIDNSGLIKTEHYIEEVIYHYDYRSKK